MNTLVVFKSFEVRGITLTSPDGRELPAVDIDFTTASDPDQPQKLTAWPTIRMSRTSAQQLLQQLSTVLSASRPPPGTKH